MTVIIERSLMFEWTGMFTQPTSFYIFATIFLKKMGKGFKTFYVLDSPHVTNTPRLSEAFTPLPLALPFRNGFFINCRKLVHDVYNWMITLLKQTCALEQKTSTGQYARRISTAIFSLRYIWKLICSLKN